MVSEMTVNLRLDKKVDSKNKETALTINSHRVGYNGLSYGGSVDSPKNIRVRDLGKASAE